jgi:hypothetical protein
MGRLKQIQAGMAVAPGSSTAGATLMADQAQYDTTAAILANMGDEGCTKHYDGVFYLGCW